MLPHTFPSASLVQLDLEPIKNRIPSPAPSSVTPLTSRITITTYGNVAVKYTNWRREKHTHSQTVGPCNEKPNVVMIRVCYTAFSVECVAEKPFTLPDDLMPPMRIAATRMELSSRQTARCQSTGPVSSRPEDLCRATWLRRTTPLITPVCVCLCVCVFLTPSNTRWGSALGRLSRQLKHECGCPPKHHWY